MANHTYDTKTILIANQKGGVGKTYIADELVFGFERNGLVLGDTLGLRDYDGQGGLIHEPTEATNPAIVVIDTPGALQPQLHEWIKESDLIIVPTLMTKPCMEPLKRMMEILLPWQATGKKVGVVLNQWDRYTACDDFAEWFDDTFPHVNNIEVANSEYVKQAQEWGKSIVDYKPHSRPASEMLCVYEWVTNLLYRNGRRA